MKRNRTALSAVALVLTVVLAAGCGDYGAEEKDDPGDQQQDNRSNGQANGQAKNPKAGAQVSVKILDYDGLMDLVAQKQGKVVVIDCWSTSCTPCMKEFHNLVEIHNEYGPEKVACISLSLDYNGIDKPEDSLPDVRRFLEAQQATFDNVLASEEDTTMYDKLGIPGAIPAVLVYDAEGQRTGIFSGGEEEGGLYAEVKAVVRKLAAGG